MPNSWITLLCFSCALTFAQENVDVRAKYENDLKTNSRSSLTHFRLGEIYLLHGNLQAAGNSFRAALTGDLQPKWVEVWYYVNLGKIYDMTGQRERAINQYRQAQRTQDNTRGAVDEASAYLGFPYPRK